MLHLVVFNAISSLTNLGGLLIISLFLQAHPWFKCIQWDKLYEMEAAHKPTVTGELDTQNFEKFDEVSMLIINAEFKFSLGKKVSGK